GADGPGSGVFLDGEGEVDVDVLGPAEFLGDLQHRLVFFLVVAAVPPDGQLVRLGTRRHREGERADGGGACSEGTDLEKLPAGLTHARVSSLKPAEASPQES